MKPTPSAPNHNLDDLNKTLQYIAQYFPAEMTGSAASMLNALLNNGEAIQTGADGNSTALFNKDTAPPSSIKTR